MYGTLSNIEPSLKFNNQLVLQGGDIEEIRIDLVVSFRMAAYFPWMLKKHSVGFNKIQCISESIIYTER